MLKYWALALIIRRALSSERLFLGFLDLGLGLLMELPSLKDQGSGEIDEQVILDFGGLGFGFGGVLVK